MPRRSPGSPPPTLTLDDLDRDELRALVARLAFRVSARDLWRVRWDVLSARASAADQVKLKAVREWEEAGAAPPSPCKSALRERLWKAYEAASRASDRAHAAADRAYAALDRTG